VALQVRAAVVRGSLEAAATLEAWSAIARTVPQHVVDGGQRAPHVWLPFAAIAALDDAVGAHGGEPLVEELHRRAADPTLRLPVFRPLAEGAFRFFGRTPSALLRWTPGALRMSLRGISEAIYEEQERGCRLVLPSPPREIMESASWRAGTRGSLRGLVESVGFIASVAQTCSDDALVHDIRWQART
jgi:hypothetical protein